MKLPKVYVGIEFECGYPRKWQRVACGSYHSGITIPGTHWEVQTDGSLSCRTSECTPYELVSEPLYSVAMVKEAVMQLQALRDNANDPTARQFFELNESMGCHLHIGAISLQRKMYFITGEVMATIKQRYADWLKISYPSVYTKYKSHYNRNYAHEFGSIAEAERHWAGRGGGRYVEWNMTSSTGVEWRSFNLLGVDSFTVLMECLVAVYKIIHSEFSKQFALGCESFSSQPKESQYNVTAPDGAVVRETQRASFTHDRSFLDAYLGKPTVVKEKSSMTQPCRRPLEVKTIIKLKEGVTEDVQS